MFTNDAAYRDVTFIEGLLSEKQLEEMINQHKNKAIMLILDDLMLQVTSSEMVGQICTRYAHHNKICFINLMQQCFPQGKMAKTISTNMTYLLLTRNIKDVQQLVTLSYQLFGKQKQKQFLQAYQDATDYYLFKIPVTYLLVNCHPLYEHRNFRLFTRCLEPDKEFPVVYKI